MSELINREDIDYSDVLKVAGYEIKAFKEGGMYQGIWAAIIKDDKGLGIMSGDFGSCSVCDPLESALGWEDTTLEALKEFAAGYLDAPVRSYEDWLIEEKWKQDWSNSISSWVEDEWNRLTGDDNKCP